MRTVTNRVTVSKAARSGFTLVELLVVIGIIALLISILLPSLNRAREAAKAIKCGANLHSIGEALAIYLQDNKGMCPIGYWDGTADPATGTTIATPTADHRKTNWCLLLLHSMNGKIATNAYDIGQLAGIGGVPTTLQMMQCPSVPSEVISKTNQLSYQYTAHPRIFALIGNGNTTDGATGRRWTTMRASRIKRSSEMLTVFDGSLSIDPTSGTWTAAYDIPSAQGLDNGKILYGDSTGTTFLTDNSSLATYNAPKSTDPVNMAGFYGNTTAFNTDDVAGSYKNANNIRFRHIGNGSANALMFDGHVQTFKISKVTGVCDLLRGNVNVSY